MDFRDIFSHLDPVSHNGTIDGRNVAQIDGWHTVLHGTAEPGPQPLNGP